jgi:hypothetical protein
MKLLEAAAKKRAEFLASCIDSFLQDFLDRGAANDRLGTIIAASRLAQMGQVLVEEFQANANQLIEGTTDVVAATRAAKIVLDMVNKNGDECRRLIGESSVPDTVPTPDRSLS